MFFKRRSFVWQNAAAGANLVIPFRMHLMFINDFIMNSELLDFKIF